MKNYLLDKEKRGTFILNYEVQNNKINIRLANGVKYSVPYSKDNEKAILNKMKDQVAQANYYKEHKKNEIKINNVFTVFVLGMMGFGTALSLSGAVDTTPALAFTVASLSLPFAGIQISSYFHTRDIAELEKNKLFISEEDRINKSIKQNSNILNNTKTKTKELTKTTNYNGDVLDINKMDKVSLKELYKILDNMKLENQVKFDYENTNSLDKPKILTRNRKMD